MAILPTDAHSHTHDCSCDHGGDHDHEHSHDHNPLKPSYRWLSTILIVGVLLFSLRSFIIGQMLVRVTSYSANASYDNAIRICHKIIAIDQNNKQAWVSLGYAYMDLSEIDMAIPVFEKVLSIDPEDKGAASFELGKAYYLKGDYAKAIGYFERVRSAGLRAAALLDADILKYRHGTLGFRSVNSMQTLLGDLLESYKKTGSILQAKLIQQEYEANKSKHSRVLF